jgi:hypothetical protein
MLLVLILGKHLYHLRLSTICNNKSSASFLLCRFCIIIEQTCKMIKFDDRLTMWLIEPLWNYVVLHGSVICNT